MVAVTLNGLGPEYKAFDTSISIRQDMPDFNELVALFIHEKIVHAHFMVEVTPERSLSLPLIHLREEVLHLEVG